jgi:hypothetical protein
MNDADEVRAGHALEVPLATVPARGSRRGILAGLAVCAVLAASIALSVLAREPSARPEATAMAVLPSVTSKIEATAAPSESPVAERLPEVRSVPLEGAPGLGFLRREGDQLTMLAWHPDGSGLRTIARVPHAYAGISNEQDSIGSMSHDGSLALIRTPLSGPGDGAELVRIVSRAGLVWERRGVTSSGPSLWANDANRVVVPLDNGTWLVVDLEGRGEPDVRTIKIAGIEPPGPPPGLDFVPRPLAFSADGRSVYGEAAANADPQNRALFRAAASGGRATRIRALPVDGPSRAISDLYDPATGRTVDPTGFPNGNISSLVVRNTDGSRAWEARFPTIVSTAWLGDGRLVVMHSDRFDGPRYLSLIAIGGEGSVTQSLLDAGPVAGGDLLGVRDGYVVAGYFVQAPSEELLVVMMDPDDGRAGTLHLTAGEFAGLQLGGWLT